MIDGVKLTRLTTIADDRGSIRHMLRRDDPHFTQFGEIYFSTIKRGVVKAWHLHKEMTLNYTCVLGKVMVVCIDGRDDSPTFAMKNAFYLDTDSLYLLLTIPPGVWNGFRIPSGHSAAEAIVANCATLPHSSWEIDRLHPDDALFDFDWGPYKVAG